jgi:hypothetical protein
MFLRNIGWLSTDYTALYPSRWNSSCSPLWGHQSQHLDLPLKVSVCCRQLRHSHYIKIVTVQKTIPQVTGAPDALPNWIEPSIARLCSYVGDGEVLLPITFALKDVAWGGNTISKHYLGETHESPSINRITILLSLLCSAGYICNWKMRYTRALLAIVIM